MTPAKATAKRETLAEKLEAARLQGQRQGVHEAYAIAAGLLAHEAVMRSDPMHRSNATITLNSLASSVRKRLDEIQAKINAPA